MTANSHGSPPPRIAPAEMEILRYVMEHQPVTVRQVADAMAERKGLARTTVQTMLERLRAKRHLTRKELEGVNKYALRIAPAELLKNMVGDFINNALGGSVSPFMAYLTERADLTDSQAVELQKIVDQFGPRKEDEK